MSLPLISSGHLPGDALAGRVAVVTGAGRGIGFETARSLLSLGARVVIAEVDPAAGEEAAVALREEFGYDRCRQQETDVGSEESVERLREEALAWFGQVDIVVNNATIVPVGAVVDLPVLAWDESYRVNLRGPVLLARAFLPGMVKRRWGVFVCVSSVGEGFLGAYESFKAGQGQLGVTLAGELEGSGVRAFTLDPGMVRTPGLQAAVQRLAPLQGLTVEGFYSLVEEHELSVEAAGAGFAAAVALAEEFQGQEVSAMQALLAAGVEVPVTAEGIEGRPGDAAVAADAVGLSRRVRQTLEEQAAGWAERSLFERRWMLRDFRRNAGRPVEGWLARLHDLEEALERGEIPRADDLGSDLGRLERYYDHMKGLARGYESDEVRLAAHLGIIEGWRLDVARLRQSLYRGA